MRVILRSDVANVGKKGDLVDVSDGYGRNFLIARGLALVATKGVIAQAEAMRASRARRDAHDRAAAEELARTLSAKTIRVSARAGADGRLFGSVTAADVAEAVQSQAGVELDRRKLHLSEPIRALGVHELPIRLHDEVEAHISVEVAPEA